MPLPDEADLVELDIESEESAVGVAEPEFPFFDVQAWFHAQRSAPPDPIELPGVPYN
jgi:hypothetical protein